MKLGEERSASAASTDAAVIVVGIFHEELTEAAESIERATGGLVQRLAELGEFTPDVGKTIAVHLPAGVKSPYLVLVGLGHKADFGPAAAFKAFATGLRTVTDRRRTRITCFAERDWSLEVQRSAVAGSLNGCHGADLYRKSPMRHQPDELFWSGVKGSSLAEGEVTAEAIMLTRRLVNEPPSTIYPESFAEVAHEVATETEMAIDVWGPDDLEREECGALLAVGRGSQRTPRLVILRYEGGSRVETASDEGEARDLPWLALVGKGVTFDSGGLSLKNSAGMLTMKSDMAGAATVLGAMQAIAKLELPVNVMGVMGLVENMPSANAYKLGDILKTRAGKTIEVHNTDAEGRLVLADALNVAVDLGAAKIIDLATLTGSVVVALGMDVAGIMTNDQAWCDQVQAAGQRCGEPLWQLPMFAEYGEQVRGTVGDLKNVGDGRWGGAITAAKLLEEFVAGRPWVHIDFAGPAFYEKPRAWCDAGGSGFMVRSLIDLVRKL